MVNYRRARVSGATYFFTVNLRNRKSALLVERIDALRSAFREVRRRTPFTINAVVILPDHLHTIWTLPENDADYASRWRAIKARFTRALRSSGLVDRRTARGDYDVWQGRYWEHLIRDDDDFERHVSYIHYNPVKHGLVQRPVEWRWSSIHRFIRSGILPATWAVEPASGQFGE